MIDIPSGVKVKVDHIGIAVRDLVGMTALYEQLGLIKTEQETVEEQGVQVGIIPAGETRIELLCPFTEESPVAKFIEKKGEGLHHVALAVTDIRETIQRCLDNGVKMIDVEPRLGAGGCLIAFLHPKSTGGTLIELTQRPTEVEPH